MKRHGDIKGFTLYETVIVLGILVLLIVIIPPLFINFNRLFATQNNLADVQIQNSFAIDAIAAETRRAKGVISSRTIKGTLFTTGTSTLIFEYPVFDSNDDLVSGETSYGVFHMNETDPEKLDFIFDAAVSSARSDIDRTIGNYINTLIFRYNKSNVASTTVVTAFIKTSKTLGGVFSSVSQTSAFTLRNL